MKLRTISGVMILLAGVSLLPMKSHAGTLGSDVIGMFPKNVGEFVYADLRKARQFTWFSQLKDQMLPSRFRQFEHFLASAGIDPNTQVGEIAWAAIPAGAPKNGDNRTWIPTSEQIVGVALGQFSPASAEEYFKGQKLHVAKVRGYTLFAFGSGTGPNDLFFFFIDSNTAAFGHREALENLIEVRFGDAEGLLRNGEFFPLISELNGRGTVWAVLNPAYARLAVHQMVPETAQFPQASDLIAKLQSLLIHIDAGREIQTRFQAVCSSPDDANTFAALLQAGLLYRRYLENEANPELAKLLESVRVAPHGERLDLRMSLTDEQITALIRRNTFTVKM